MAIPIIIDTWRICATCLQYIVNHDLSSLSLYMSDDEIDQKQEDIDEALDSLAEKLQTTGSCGENESFEYSPCDCCGAADHGNRYDCDILDASPMGERAVIEGFVSDILPALLRTELKHYSSMFCFSDIEPDKPSRSLAFSTFVDNLHRDGDISDHIRDNICIPDWCLERLAIDNSGVVFKVDLTQLDWK